MEEINCARRDAEEPSRIGPWYNRESGCVVHLPSIEDLVGKLNVNGKRSPPTSQFTSTTFTLPFRISVPLPHWQDSVPSSPEAFQDEDDDENEDDSRLRIATSPSSSPAPSSPQSSRSSSPVQDQSIFSSPTPHLQHSSAVPILFEAGSPTVTPPNTPFTWAPPFSSPPPPFSQFSSSLAIVPSSPICYPTPTRALAKISFCDLSPSIASSAITTTASPLIEYYCHQCGREYEKCPHEQRCVSCQARIRWRCLKCSVTVAASQKSSHEGSNSHISHARSTVPPEQKSASDGYYCCSYCSKVLAQMPHSCTCTVCHRRIRWHCLVCKAEVDATGKTPHKKSLKHRKNVLGIAGTAANGGAGGDLEGSDTHASADRRADFANFSWESASEFFPDRRRKRTRVESATECEGGSRNYLAVQDSA